MLPSSFLLNTYIFPISFLDLIIEGAHIVSLPSRSSTAFARLVKTYLCSISLQRKFNLKLTSTLQIERFPTFPNYQLYNTQHDYPSPSTLDMSSTTPGGPGDGATPSQPPEPTHTAEQLAIIHAAMMVGFAYELS